MENRALVNRSMLDDGSIDYGAFTASLMREAARLGLLDEQGMRRMQDQLLSLLGAQIQRLTRGDSSSIPLEAADGLMDGIGYCIDIALKNRPTADDSLGLLLETSMDGLYQTGCSLLEGHARACEALLSRVRATRTRTVNEGYNITLDHTLPQYLRDWKSARFPQDFAVLTEYPAAGESGLSGIAGVRARLSDLALENRFCGRFQSVLDGLLGDWARQNRTTPEEAYVNLFTLALQNLLLCRMLGRDGAGLTPEDCGLLEERLAPLTGEQRGQAVLRAAELLLEGCAFGSAPLEAHIRAGAKALADALNHTGGRLEGVAAIHRGEEGFLHVDGERLDNDAFKSVAEEVLLCNTARRKARLLRNELRSLEDLWDMLGADVLFDEEYDEVFDSFDAVTCALLLSRLTAGPREDGLSVPADAPEWQQRFSEWLNRQPPAKRSAIWENSRALR